MCKVAKKEALTSAFRYCKGLDMSVCETSRYLIIMLIAKDSTKTASYRQWGVMHTPVARHIC